MTGSTRPRCVALNVWSVPARRNWLFFTILSYTAVILPGCYGVFPLFLRALRHSVPVHSAVELTHPPFSCTYSGTARVGGRRRSRGGRCASAHEPGVPVHAVRPEREGRARAVAGRAVRPLPPTPHQEAAPGRRQADTYVVVILFALSSRNLGGDTVRCTRGNSAWPLVMLP